ncbi:MAG: DUF1080 domain-containing protein [Fuerstiella sp.]|nr:DUF1080 domain-containing protein [Fuerstiella sp.]
MCKCFVAATAVLYLLNVSAAFLFVSPTLQAQTDLAAPDAAAPDESWSEPRDLLKGEFKSCWKHFSCVDETPLTSVWKRKVDEEAKLVELVCTGDPRGYLYTNEEFDEFELTFEWRFVSDANGNSGILMFTQDDQRLWPTSIQVQLHQPEAGSIFPGGEAVTGSTVRKEDLANPVGEWNKCRIISRDRGIVVHVNGKKAGEVNDCKPARGRIAIQSEGSVVHFRRILIRTPETADDRSSEDRTRSDENS